MAEKPLQDQRLTRALTEIEDLKNQVRTLEQRLAAIEQLLDKRNFTDKVKAALNDIERYG